MKITLINGSPKTGHSASGVLLSALQTMLPPDAVIENIGFHHPGVDESEIAAVLETDVLVFAFPLYVDGIPSHLLRSLIQLEEALTAGSGAPIRVFAIVNCGFYEGRQAAIALQMMKHWCDRAGAHWGQGAGIGGGGFLASLQGIAQGRGATRNLWRALKSLAGNLTTPGPAEDIFTVPNCPRSVYRIGGNLSWRKAIRTNGLPPAQLGRRP